VIILAIDPGNTQSAFVLYDATTERVLAKRKVDNELALVALHGEGETLRRAEHLAIEMAESFGAKVWSQVFTTVLWTGRFIEAWSARGLPFALVTRRQVKMQLCGSGKAKDGQIRNCLIERWGGADVALGSKAEPGPLRGVTADCWQALAIGVVFAHGLNSAASVMSEAA
jgi:Holliday junction resolvasome RuvABC endonuclease subunit